MQNPKENVTEKAEQQQKRYHKCPKLSATLMG